MLKQKTLSKLFVVWLQDTFLELYQLVMSFHQEFVTLNNGNKIPGVAVIGTGTRWFKKTETEETFSQELVEQIKFALSLPGIVHIDAAEIYRTYPEVSQALKESNKPRNEIFITDKYSTQIKVSEKPTVGLDAALAKLNLDYVDLYLLHSPFVEKEKNGFTLEESWKHMESLYKAGKAKNIGVSNFAIKDLERILKIAEIKPQINQIEYNAFLQNQTPGIYSYCQQHDIQLEAYSPLGPLQKKPADADKLPFHQYINQLANKYGVTDGQVLLRWVSKRGVIPVTTSGKNERIKAAQDLFLFDLEDDEVNEITRLGLEHPSVRLYWNQQYDQYNKESQKA